MSKENKKSFLRKIERVVEEVQKVSWYTLSVSDIFLKLNSSPEGLSQDEAQKRLSIYGTNELPQEESEPVWKLLLNQFKSPLMYIMLAAFFVSLFIGNGGEAIFIGIVMVSNAIVGFYQEYKANSSIRALKGAIKFKARVLRAGREQEIEVKNIVPGDVLVVHAGDKVVADCRIIEQTGLKVNEASLTGESKSVEKNSRVLKDETPVSDRQNMIFMGTLVEEGSAKVLVVETGTKTEYGDIVRLLKETPEEATPLQKTMLSLSKIIGIFISIFVGAILIEGYLKGLPFIEIFSTALALFVSAIPEGLLPAVTIVLAIGMRRILRHKGLVRRLASTETLGGVTLICTDKTGTLTEGKMTVSRLLSLSGDYEFDFKKVGPKSVSDINKEILRIPTFTNDAFIENPEAGIDDIVIRGRPTEVALLKAAFVLGIDKYDLNKKHKVNGTVFFSSERKYSASLREMPGAEDKLFVIGAPEKIVSLATEVLDVNGEKVKISSPKGQNLIKQMQDLIDDGYRLIASAYKDFGGVDYKNLEDEVSDLVLVGFIALSDPVRSDVAEAFRKTEKAGIKTVIITGDHKATALAVAKEIGLPILPDQVLEGAEIEHMTPDDLKKRVANTLLFARVSPRHKLQIVEAYQKRGEVVAMFGDGVNDAPALKMADIGVAVSSEVDAVREVADLVLLDSGFNTVVKAIEGGRMIFRNIRRVFLYLIVQDFSQFFLFLVSIALGLPLPLIAAQLFMINIVESGLPDLALTTEEDTDGLMDEPPRKPGESILNKPSFRWMISVFALSGLFAIGFYYFVLNITGDVQLTRTMVMLLMCMESLFLALVVRSFKKPILRKDIFANKWLTSAIIISFVMILAAVYYPPLQNVLQTVSLTTSQFMFTVIANVLLVFFVDEVKKKLFNAPE